MKKPNTKEISAELATLKDMAPRIRQRDAFGGNNRAGIDAQIKVIENNLSESAILDRWGGEDDCDIYSSAQEARQWLDGESDDGLPSDNWKPLLTR